MALERLSTRRDDPRDPRRARKAQRDFSPAVFWMLLLAGMAVLGACVVVPAWMNSQMLARQHTNLSERLAQSRLWAKADSEAVEAATSNAAFNERLLIEELNYQRPGEQVLLADSGLQALNPKQTVQPVLGAGPAWLRAFVERDTRNILLAMSGGLVLFAFVYYPAGRKSKRPKELPMIPVHRMDARFNGPRQTWQSTL